MKPTEVVMLTGYIQAHFPQQPVNEFTAEALEEQLAAYPLPDCKQAVLNIAERGEHWCAPTDVKAEVKRMREKRIAEYGPIEPPASLDPDDSGALARWMREQTRAIADGTITAPPEIEWDGPEHDVIAELGYIGQEIPDA